MSLYRGATVDEAISKAVRAGYNSRDAIQWFDSNSCQELSKLRRRALDNVLHFERRRNITQRAVLKKQAEIDKAKREIPIIIQFLDPPESEEDERRRKRGRRPTVKFTIAGVLKEMVKEEYEKRRAQAIAKHQRLQRELPPLLETPRHVIALYNQSNADLLKFDREMRQLGRKP